MSKKIRSLLCLAAIAALLIVPALSLAQDAPAAADAAGAADVQMPPDDGESSNTGLLSIMFGSGWVGTVLWLALIGDSVAATYLIIDFFITINPKRIIPEALVADVREAMEQGDVMKAMQRCEQEPGAMSNILLAGFRNVKEGFDVIEEQVGAAADLESEKLMQRVSYLNMCGSIAPMLGLLGTVQGMIMAFSHLATSQAGAAQQGQLAMDISQALWTTAGGLVVAIPAVSFYTYFKNRLSRIILSMEGLTLDLIKALRNVEVVEE